MPIWSDQAPPVPTGRARDGTAPSTERQRVRDTILFRPCDRVPWQINYTSQLGEILLEELGFRRHDGGARDDPIARYGRLDEFLGNHIAYVRNRGLHSTREVSRGIWRDEWGVLWDRRIDGDIGTPVNCLLESSRLSELHLPDPDDPDRYSHVQPIVEANPGRYILAKFSYSLFERAWSLRSMERLLVDFAFDPAFVHELFGVICNFNLSVMKNLRSFAIDGIYFGDDWGSQRAMLMSPEMWRQLIKPFLRSMYAQAHLQGYDVFIHSCGDITPVLDDLVEVGLNAFNPFQPEVMDTAGLMHRYSRRLAFYGGVSIQKTLPFGSQQEVRAEVHDRLSLARKLGGLVVSPSHDMPRDVPVANVLAMVDALRTQ
jgi:uroporphyrinogen decarboxylase